MEHAAPHTHEAVLKRLQAWPPEGRLLDAPSGAGTLAKRLRALGWTVHTVDQIAHDDAHHLQADLNQPLPFEDASFAAAVSVEGIEHLESPSAWLRELSRVLRPGGRLIVTTPNVLSARSRWRLLTRGYFKHFTPQPDGSQSSEHIHPLPYPLLVHLMAQADLQVQGVFCNRMQASLRDRWVASTLMRFEQHPLGDVLGTDDLLYGQILGVEAIKASGPVRSR